MAITPQDMRDAAFLSNAAYLNEADLDLALASEGWDLREFHSMPTGTLIFGVATGFVAVKNGVMVVSIRGSNGLYLPNYLDAGLQSPHYFALNSLFDFAVDLSSSAQISKILVTGHSLGGAMAERFVALQAADLHGKTISAITFGSPGVTGIIVPDVAAQETVSVFHTGDLVPNLGSSWFVGGQFFGSRISVDLPTLSGLTAEHDKQLYRSTADAIAGSSLAHSLFLQGRLSDYNFIREISDFNDTRHGSNRADFIIGFGNDEIAGNGGSDIIDAGSGMDTVRGGDANDTISGGNGNDDIDGGTGTDTVVFGMARSSYNVTFQGSEVIVTPSSILSLEGTDTIRNVERFSFADRIYQLSELQTPTGDTTPPQLTLKIPSDDQTGVTLISTIALWFDEAVHKGTGNIEIRKSSNGELFQRIAITDTGKVNFSGNTVTIDPSYNFEPGTSYYVTVASGAIINQAGLPYGGIISSTEFNFTTASPSDTSAPVLNNSETTPRDNASGVAANANIVLSFNELILPPSSGTVDIYRGDGSLFRSIALSDRSQVTHSLNTLTINPSIDFAAGADFNVRVSSGAIHDIYGNAFAGIASPTELNFTTASAPYVPPPVDRGVFASITGNSARENSGPLTFNVTLTGAAAGTQNVLINYTTEEVVGSNKADSGFDFVPTSGTLLIPAGQRSGTITVPLQPDTVQESDEVFSIRLSQPSSGVTLSNITATGTILNDDSAPNRSPQAKPDIAITAPGTPVLVNVLENDIDPDGNTPLSVISIGFQNGPATIAVAGGGGNVLFTPISTTNAITGFFYNIQDALGAPSNGFTQVIIGGDGSPPVVNQGTDDNDIIQGNGGNDVLSGGYGADTLAGGPGADRIDGGAGFDFLDLRQGAHGANLAFENVWIADDGDGDHDVIENIEGVLGTRFADTIDGFLPPALAAATGYNFYGNDGNDSLSGNLGDDTLDGGAGNDELRYGSGRDIVFGGVGDDLLHQFSGGLDTVGDQLDGGAGEDTIRVSGWSADDAHGGAGHDLLVFGNGDTLSGDNGADTFTPVGYRFNGSDMPGPYQAWITDLKVGEQIKWDFTLATVVGGVPFFFLGPITNGTGTTTAQNRVEFTTAGGETTLYFGHDSIPGADFILSIYGTFTLDQLEVIEPTSSDHVTTIRIQGGTGNDTIIGGGTSANSYNGAGGNDTIDYSETMLGVVVNLAAASNHATGPEIGTDQISNVENVIGGSGSDTVTGDGANNVLHGNGGNDTLAGGSGHDTLRGGLGNDTLNGGANSDTADLQDATGAVILTLDASGNAVVTAAGIDTDTLTGIENVTSGSGNDNLTGNTSANTFIGGLGADTLNGADGDDIIYATHDDGNDTITGGNGFDILDFSQVNGVVQINQLAGTITGSAGNDTLLDVIEQIKGTNFNDALSGGHGINVLDGEGGNDQFFGNNGDDLMRGGTGNDTFYFSTSDGNDTLLGGDGFDVLDYSSLLGVVQVNQLAGTTTGTANNDVLADVFEQVIGTAFGDVLSGGHGINSLKGNGGDDQLFANNGDDYTSGGDGNDTITMGIGNDTHDFRNGEDTDTILDFTAGGTEDTITLTFYSGLGITTFAQLEASGRLSTVSGHAELSLNGGDKIIFNNVASHLSLTAADFVF